MTGVLVIGLGNRYRRDDAAGLAVAARLLAAGLPGVQVRELEGEPSGLIDAWAGADRVYLADAVCSGAPAGTVHRIDASGASASLRAGPWGTRGTHAFSLADAIELGRALRRVPPRLIAYGIEGAEFGAGTGLSPAVAHGVEMAARRLIGELAGPARAVGTSVSAGPAPPPPPPGRD